MHTKNLRVVHGNGIGTGEGSDYRSIGTAYGWNEEFIYDAEKNLINSPTASDEALANARLWAAAPDMLSALRRAVLALAFAAESSPAMRDDYNAVSAAIDNAIGAPA